LEAAIAIPPAAPASAAPPATSGTFALLAALPTLFPAPPTASRTASTFECFEPEPFARDLPLEAPLLELRFLLLADFALAFAAFGFDDFDDDFAFEAFDDDLAFAFEVDLGFDDDCAADGFARFGADRFFVLPFVWAIVPLSSELVPFAIHRLVQWIGYPIHCREISMDEWVQRFSPPRRRRLGSA
jgi:hypothetical protein